MLNTLFDPSLLLISEEKWNNEEIRDKFLEHLLNLLDFINDYSCTKIYWTTQLEELLWEHPQIPPWRTDRDWKLSVIPILVEKFNNNRVFLEPLDSIQATVTPALHQSFGKTNILDCFYILIHTLLIKKENTFFCLGLENISNDEYYFSCNCHKYELKNNLIKTSKDWLKYLDLENDFWPSDVTDKEFSKFFQALEILRQRDYEDKPFLFSFTLSNNFKNDICSTTKYRLKILEKMTKKLILTSAEAGKDRSLKDEYITQKKEYRFRVTQRPSSTRIHYTVESDEIEFLRYYGEGHHDDGL